MIIGKTATLFIVDDVPAAEPLPATFDPQLPKRESVAAWYQEIEDQRPEWRDRPAWP